MANVKISALPAVTTVVPGTDVLPLVSNSGATTTKATPNDVVNATLISPGPIGSTTPNTGKFSTFSTTGAAGIGTTPATATTIRISNNITGATVGYGTQNQSTVQSDVTSQARYYSTYVNTAAASFTLGTLGHFYATQGTIGSGSTVTNQYGHFAESSLTGATNNYGFYGGIASGSGRYNFYAGGTAANYFAGDLTIYGGTAIPAGGTAGSGYKLSSTANFGVFFGSGAPTLSAAKGSLYLRSDGTGVNDRMYVNTNGSTTWTAVVTVA